MRDLAEFAAYARSLADGGHLDTCPSLAARPLYEPRWSPPPCPGCVTSEQRAEWERLATEAEARLSTDPEPTLL